MDFSIKNDVNIIDVVGAYVALKKKGAEHVGVCPFHDDHKESLQVNERKNIFKCFACGEGGDSVDFLTAMGKTHKQAIEELSGGIASESMPKRNEAVRKDAPKWSQIMPASPPTAFAHWKHGEPSMKWLYRDATGKPIGYVCRFDLDGGKEVLPYIYATDGTRSEWIWRGFSKPTPLYGLHLLAKHPNATVVMVEGEKTADAVNAQLDNERAVAVSWQGGANGIEKAGISALAGRRAILWPDNDVAGLSAMLHLRHLAGFSESMIVPLDSSLPKGWDAADVEWKDGELRNFMRGRLANDMPVSESYDDGGFVWRLQEIGRETAYEFGLIGGRWSMRKYAEPTKEEATQVQESQTAEATAPDASMPPHESPHEPPQDIPPHNESDPQDQYTDAWFRFMGYDKGENTQRFYFYVFRSNQVVSLSPSSMTTSNLLLLAPLDWWEYSFPGKPANSNISVSAASNYLIENSIRVGIFNADFIRGRGAWTDGKDTVIHCGSHLIVNGHYTQFNEYRSKYIYERGYDLGFAIKSEAKPSEGRKFLDMLQLVAWDRPVSAYLLAGWCVIAPMCGALRWRPHVWITGAAGTGKSWIFDKILKRMLAGTAVAVQSETTEAGIRQYLGHDALPVIFDEAEGEDRRSQERIQSVLTLMRGASTHDGGMILKGSAGGAATRYNIKSCFAYASIGVSLNQQSDRSRVTILSVNKFTGDGAKERWKRIQKAYNELFADEFAERIQSRTISLLPIILRNAATFSDAAASVLGDQRAGDQVGALLAGAYSLVSNKAISFDDAVAWIEDKDWSEERGLDETKDEVRLITHLIERVARVEVGGKYYDRTIGELINIACAPQFYDDNIGSEDARKRLLTMGFRIDYDAETLIVSNTAEFIKNSLKDTAWANNHTAILKRLDGAVAKEGTTFGSQLKSRGVAIPLSTIFG